MKADFVVPALEVSRTLESWDWSGTLGVAGAAAEALLVVSDGATFST